MKKALLFAFLFLFLTITIIFSQNFIKKEYEHVQWNMPDDWQTYEESFMPGVAYYNGKLGSGNEIAEGAVFTVVTQEGFASNVISEMKKDPSTDLQIEAQNYLNGMKRNYYEGLIDDNGKTIWFTLSYFPSTEEYFEFMIFAIASGPDINRDKAILNHVIASVDVIEKDSQLSDSQTGKVLLTLINSANGRYLPNGTIEFEYEVEEGLLKGSPWVGIVPSEIQHGDEAENDKHDLTYQYLSSNQDRISFTAPLKEGFYDIRLHDSDFSGKELGYISFEVKDENEALPIITTDKVVYKPGEEIKVTYENAPAKTTRDWIGVYRETSDESGYLSWQYLNGKTEGELSFIAPRDEDSYNLRMFDDDSYNTLTVSEPFNVIQEDITTPDDKKEVIFISKYVFCSEISDGKPVDNKIKFSKDDDKIYIHLTIEEYQKEHTLSWEWIKPDGEVYDTVELDLQSAVDLGYKTIRDYNVWAWLQTSTLDDSMKGIWKINIYMDNDIVLTRQFVFY